MFFSLDEPRILIGKKKQSTEDTADGDALKHFISCNRVDCSENENSVVAYPEEWKSAEHGLNYLLRQRRDRVMDNVSTEDIRNKGRKMVNPLIGVIPSRTEIEDQLNELLLSM